MMTVSSASLHEGGIARQCIDSGDFDVMQLNYSLLDRSNEENIALCMEKGIGVFVKVPPPEASLLCPRSSAPSSALILYNARACGLPDRARAGQADPEDPEGAGQLGGRGVGQDEGAAGTGARTGAFSIESHAFQAGILI